MALGLLGKKIGMTQIYEGDAVFPVTIVQAGPNVVLALRTLARDQYSAVQLGFDEKRVSRCTLPELGHFKAAGATPKKLVREFRLDADPGPELAVGASLGVALFAAGQRVDVTGTSKGKGFQGVMKRHHFKGSMTKSHGTHEYQRHPGSIGMRLTPGRVWKGMRMGGQMGNERCTVSNLVVKKVDPERQLLFIHGAVPGPQGGYVLLHPTRKMRLGPGGGPRIVYANLRATDAGKGNKNKK